MGLPPVYIPVVAKLTGTPVQIEGATLGLNMLGETPSLDFGDILVNGQAKTRALRVRNAAPWPVAVDWKVLEAAPAGEGNLVSLSSAVSPEGVVVFTCAAVEPPEATSSAFSLDAPQLLVPAHSTKPVTISCQWHKPQHHEVFLKGEVSFLPKDTPMPGQESAGDKDRCAPSWRPGWEGGGWRMSRLDCAVARRMWSASVADEARGGGAWVVGGAGWWSHFRLWSGSRRVRRCCRRSEAVRGC